MSHAVAALGTGAFAVAGCVWYVPALADLRAGADRPHSRRIAAAACVTGWAGVGAVTVLLLMADGWWAPAVTAVVAAVASATLHLYAAVQRGREAREAAQHWTRLGHVPSPAGPGRSRNVVAAVVVCGMVVSVPVAVWQAVSGPGDSAGWAVAAVTSATVMGVFLVAAGLYARATDRVAHRTAVTTGRGRSRS